MLIAFVNTIVLFLFELQIQYFMHNQLNHIVDFGKAFDYAMPLLRI